MNSTTPQYTDTHTSFSRNGSATVSLLAGFTWIVALLLTACTVVFRLTFALVSATVRYALKYSVYLLLGTLFICSAFILVVLSIITLGAVSIP